MKMDKKIFWMRIIGAGLMSFGAGFTWGFGGVVFATGLVILLLLEGIIEQN